MRDYLIGAGSAYRQEGSSQQKEKKKKKKAPVRGGKRERERGKSMRRGQKRFLKRRQAGRASCVHPGREACGVIVRREKLDGM